MMNHPIIIVTELIKKTQFDPICKNTFQSHITIFITDYIREKIKQIVMTKNQKTITLTPLLRIT